MPAIRPSIKSAFILAFLAALCASYFLNTPIPFFLSRLHQVGITLLILWSAGGWGKTLIKADSHLTPLENVLFPIVLGLGILSSVMMLLGCLGAWTAVGAGLLIFCGILLSPPFLKKIRRLISIGREMWLMPSEYLWPTFAIAVGLLLSLSLAFAPITYYDSLVYHLALPAAYIQARHWVALPHLIYSAFPQTLEMLWTLALLVGNDIVANLLAWSMEAALFISILAFSKRFLDLSVGLIATAWLALMPALMLLSSGGYIDVGLALFSFMAFYTACLWTTTASRSLLLCAGLFAGWAIGTKYIGALPAALTTIYLVRHAAKYQERSEWPRSAALFLGAVLLTAGPWGLKNILYVGNPVFPFFRHWGIQTLNPWVKEAAGGYFAGITEYYSRSWFELPAVIWDAAVNGIGFGRGIDVLGDFGWIPLLGFLPALWLCRKWPPKIWILLVFSLGFFVPWATSRPVLRFLLPLAPFLALLSAYAWVHGVRPQKTALRWSFRLFLGSFLLSGLFLFFYVMNLLSPFKVITGMEEAHTFLSRQLDYYPAATFINTQTPPDSHVYVFGDQRGYYYQRKIWISPAFSRNPLMQWAHDAPTSRDFIQKLKEQGITHLVVNRNEFKRLQNYPFYRFDAQGQRLWESFQTQTKPIYQDKACDVYAL